MQQAWEESELRRLEQLLEASEPAKKEADFRGWEWFYLKDQ
jgi:hypothetical protein